MKISISIYVCMRILKYVVQVRDYFRVCKSYSWAQTGMSYVVMAVQCVYT